MGEASIPRRVFSYCSFLGIVGRCSYSLQRLACCKLFCLMPFTRDFLFMISIQILFGRYANTDANKQIYCILRRAKFLFLYWTSMGSSNFHSRDFFTMRLSPHLTNSRITCEGDVLTYLRFIIFFGGNVIANQP